ncbi:hypothetical protein EYF80_051139 [Liparis tanakae]|uniref:Uncharacterized protein n=1 Tax=Liparis tanakae TaxID=230148 RepID=A0A4Z2FD50_9TELE|nr:hypothetical protein EYF80_051139 [Liparis tanakae]
MALMKGWKQLKGNSGSGSSLRNSFRAPAITWTSSHWPSSRTFFLEDLSLAAQPTEAPLSSTVYSGTI